MRKPGAPIQFWASRNLGFRPAIEPVAGHLGIVLARLALDGARVALHEDPGLDFIAIATRGRLFIAGFAPSNAVRVTGRTANGELRATSVVRSDKDGGDYFAFATLESVPVDLDAL